MTNYFKDGINFQMGNGVYNKESKNTLIRSMKNALAAKLIYGSYYKDFTYKFFKDISKQELNFFQDIAYTIVNNKTYFTRILDAVAIKSMGKIDTEFKNELCKSSSQKGFAKEEKLDLANVVIELMFFRLEELEKILSDDDNPVSIKELFDEFEYKPSTLTGKQFRLLCNLLRMSISYAIGKTSQNYYPEKHDIKEISFIGPNGAKLRELVWERINTRMVDLEIPTCRELAGLMNRSPSTISDLQPKILKNDATRKKPTEKISRDLLKDLLATLCCTRDYLIHKEIDSPWISYDNPRQEYKDGVIEATFNAQLIFHLPQKK